MPKYKQDETVFDMAIYRGEQRHRVTLPKVLTDRLNTSSDKIHFTGVMDGSGRFKITVTGWKLYQTGTFRCPDCETVDTFEGDMPQPLDFYALGDEIPVSCSKCGRDTTILEDWTA